jgi:hypothetical protein
VAFRKGDLVEVRSREEILATLDSKGCFEGVPFMPEMQRFCGSQMRVAARAHKTCDTVNNIGGVRVHEAVHLENARCDGSSHGGCQAACLFFWKDAWLRPAENVESVPQLTVSPPPLVLEALPLEWSQRTAPEGSSETLYRCQATELPHFTSPLQWWDIRQYMEDLTSRNIGLPTLFRGARFALFRAIVHFGVCYRLIVVLYNWYQKRRGRSSLPWVTGKLKRTPHVELNLQPGEWVRVKSFDEILNTLDTNNKNRGLGFDTSEMRLHCGKLYRVERRVERIVNDRTGKMITFGNSCMILEGVYCTGETTQTRMFCPRAITSYWREAWLERATPPTTTGLSVAATDLRGCPKTKPKTVPTCALF